MRAATSEDTARGRPQAHLVRTPPEDVPVDLGPVRGVAQRRHAAAINRRRELRPRRHRGTADAEEMEAGEEDQETSRPAAARAVIRTHLLTKLETSRQFSMLTPYERDQI